MLNENPSDTNASHPSLTLFILLFPFKAFGNCLSQTGDCAIDALNSKYRMGDGRKIDNSERHKDFDARLHLFGTLMDDLNYLLVRQVNNDNGCCIPWHNKV